MAEVEVKRAGVCAGDGSRKDGVQSFEEHIIRYIKDNQARSVVAGASLTPPSGLMATFLFYVLAM